MATLPDTVNLALQHHQAGRLQEAEILYRQILQEHPNHPEALHRLGLIAHHVGRHEAAVELIGKAIALQPTAAEYHNDIGEAYRALGRNENAETSYRQALTLKSDLVAAQYNLGVLHRQQGRLEDAAACYRQALEINPGHVGAHNNLGNVLKAQGKVEEAVTHYRQALTLKPDFAEGYNNLGSVLQGLSQVQESIRCFQQALALKPDYVEALSNLGNAFIDEGKVEEAAAAYKRALALKPDFAYAHSNLLLAMNYDPSYTPEAIAAEHAAWNDRHARPLAPAIGPYTNERDPDRRLHVGYVSSDFHRHSVMYFFETLLAAHDRASVKVFCYSAGAQFDAVTTRLQATADVWRHIAGLSDQAADEMIRADGIDILVDLSGHTAHNRLLVFARKPAPVQVTYLGYGATTGLSVMDYRLSDAYLTPPDTTEWFSEELIRLPGCYVCYRPPDDAPPVTPLPASLYGYVTFGSFNNLAKVPPAVTSLWAEILGRLPSARLVLKDRTLADDAQRARYRSLFETHGVNPERIELIPKVVSPADHLAVYGRIDIALDPFPYNGCTTTCEALWMGAPVITLAGSLSHGRYGVSLLAALELDELAATTPADYVAKAVGLAEDPKRLTKLRSVLRPRMAASPLCDAKAFAQKVEQAYRRIWRRWCHG